MDGSKLLGLNSSPCRWLFSFSMNLIKESRILFPELSLDLQNYRFVPIVALCRLALRRRGLLSAGPVVGLISLICTLWMAVVVTEEQQVEPCITQSTYKQFTWTTFNTQPATQPRNTHWNVEVLMCKDETKTTNNISQLVYLFISLLLLYALLSLPPELPFSVPVWRDQDTKHQSK